jgi:hypothetical protein
MRIGSIDAEIARPFYGGHLSRLLWSTTRWKNFVSLRDCESVLGSLRARRV